MSAAAERFARDGYLVVEGCFDPAAGASLLERAADIVADFAADMPARSVFTTDDQVRTSDAYFLDSGDRISCFFEEEAFADDGTLAVPIDRAINKIGHAQHDLDPVFDRFSRTDALADLADELGVGGHRLVQSMLIYKQPGIGGEVGAHTDHTFLWTEPASVVGFWFALEDATLDNGCLWALPGGHRRPVDRRFRRHPAGGTRMDTIGAPSETAAEVTRTFTPLEAPAGTLAVLDGKLPHYSAANRSQRRRAAYTLHAIDPTARYPDDNWLQRPTLPLRGFRDRR
ncbi:MAG: phytanoyl-CoA dioxygenase family protein [Microthrixaceae bacterium]